MYKFEFDCPHFVFRKDRTTREQDRNYCYENNPFDVWFDIEYSERIQLSDPKKDEKDNVENEPVKRESIRMETDAQEIQFEKENKKDEVETAGENDQKTQNVPPIKNMFKKKEEKKLNYSRRNAIAFKPKESKVQRISQLKDQRKSKDEENLKIMTRSKSGLQRKILSLGNWPCHYSTKIQRIWEKINHKKWYDLSPESKKQAQKSMKSIDEKERLSQARKEEKQIEHKQKSKK